MLCLMFSVVMDVSVEQKDTVGRKAANQEPKHHECLVSCFETHSPIHQ